MKNEEGRTEHWRIGIPECRQNGDAGARRVGGRKAMKGKLIKCGGARAQIRDLHVSPRSSIQQRERERGEGSVVKKRILLTYLMEVLDKIRTPRDFLLS